MFQTAVPSPTRVDLGYGDLGFNGHTTTSTPNIDKLARRALHPVSARPEAPQRGGGAARCAARC